MTELRMNWPSSHRSNMTVTLLKGKEWDDLCTEVCVGSQSDNPQRVTEPAMKLFDWVKENGSPNDWVKDSTLAWHTGLRGKQDCVADYIKELRRKVGSAFCCEIRGQRWSRENPIEYKVWLTGEVTLSDRPPKKSIPERLNPVLNGNLEHYTKDDLDRPPRLASEAVTNSAFLVFDLIGGDAGFQCECDS